MRIATLLLAFSMIAAARAHGQDNDAKGRPDLDAVLRVLIDEKQVIRLQFDLPGKANQSFDSSEVRCALLDMNGVQLDGFLSPRPVAQQTISLPMAERSVNVDTAFDLVWKKLTPGFEYHLVVSLRNLTGLVKFKAPRVLVSNPPTPGQPKSNKPMQASIERPNRAWDYDGKRILGHVGEKVILWDATTGKVLRKLEAHKEGIHAVRFSPDGVHALSSSWVGSGPMAHYDSKDTRVLLWDLTTGAQKAAFPNQVAGEFSSDGKRIVTFCVRPGKEDWFDAVVWDAFQGSQITRARLDDSSEPRQDALHFSPDATSFAYIRGGAYPYSTNPSVAILYDASEGQGDEIGRTAWQNGGHRYTSDGMFAVFGSGRATITELKTGRIAQSVPHGLPTGLKGYQSAIWTHDGKRVAATPYGDDEIKIWNAGSRTTTTGSKCGPYPHSALIVSPDNSRLAVEWGGANNIEPGLGIYDMNTGKEIERIKLAEWGHMLGFSPDSKTILVGGSEFVIYDAETGRRIRSHRLLDDVSSPFWQ